jgi:hypothetical protein
MDYSPCFPGYTSKAKLAEMGITKIWAIQVIKHGAMPSPKVAKAIQSASGGRIRASALLDLHEDPIQLAELACPQ